MIIEPFYPWIVTSDIQDFISPPFDTIEVEEELRLKRHKNNIVHITLPDSYRDAVTYLQNLIDSGSLRKSNKSFLLVKMEYVEEGRTFTIPGILASVDVEDVNIKTHERTFQEFVDDREKLMLAIRAQPEPIFIVTEKDMDAIITEISERNENNKLFEFKFNGMKITVIQIANEAEIEKIKDGYYTTGGIIADGHHRFAATRSIYENTGNNFWKYSLAFIVSLNTPGLKISGVHRLVKSNLKFVEVLNCLKTEFNLRECESFQKDRLQLYAGGRFLLLEYNYQQDVIFSTTTELVNSLIFEKCLNFQEADISKIAHFTNSEIDIVRSVDAGEYSFGILMPSFNKQKFLEMVSKGIPFPQKSTYFNPKIPSGIALRLDL